MTLFLAALEQMGFLLLLILIGYCLVKGRILPDSAAGILSRMENWIFLPSLVLGTFSKQFTVSRFEQTGQYFLSGMIVAAVSVTIALLLSRLCTKDTYLRKIYTYGLAFSNFAFMGNAVVEALFPGLLSDYLIFTLPFFILIYLWGVPVLLIPHGEGKNSFKDRIRAFLNPMMIGMVIGMLLGISGVSLPSFLGRTVSVLGSCMSPIAMLLTGMTVARLSLRTSFRRPSVYLVTFFRLIAIPLLAIPVLMLLPLSRELECCIICVLSMPLGLNTIVVPNAYDLDTEAASEMALLSHLLSCVTVPVIFSLFNFVS